MPRLVADQLSRAYGRRVLFRGLSFELSGGEVLGVTGPNGAGKSTLLRILAGVLRPTRGAVRLELGGGQIAAPEDHMLHVGMAAPYLNLYDGLTLRENLLFIARVRGMARAAAQVEAVARQVGLEKRADEPLRAFSSGMRQRARFAAALLPEPPLLLLDEPGANLDEAGLETVSEVVQAAAARGALVVVATNDVRDLAHAGRRLCLSDYLPGAPVAAA